MNMQMSFSIPSYCDISSVDGFIEPDPDIAGIGVVSSFIAIGGAVMILALVKICRNELDGFKTTDLFCPCVVTITSDDRWPGYDDARKYLREEQEVAEDEDGVFSSALIETLYGLGDTQFATGIAICVAAMTKKDITQYHFLVCNETSWLAFLSATAGFLTSRKLLESPGSIKKAVRVLLMWLLFGLVTFIEVKRNDDLGFARQVYVTDRGWDMTDPGAVVALILLVTSIFSAIIDTISLSPEIGLLIYYYVELYTASLARIPFLTWTWASRGGNTGMTTTATRMLKCVFTAIFLVAIWFPVWVLNLISYWFFYQPLTAHAANIFFFIWGAVYTFRWRELGRSCMELVDVSKEDEFGFGQVVALTLMISPVVSNADYWIDSAKAWLNKGRSQRTSTVDFIKQVQGGEQDQNHGEDST